RDRNVTGVQTCALPISEPANRTRGAATPGNRGSSHACRVEASSAPKKPSVTCHFSGGTHRSPGAVGTSANRFVSAATILAGGTRSEERRVGRRVDRGGR